MKSWDDFMEKAMAAFMVALSIAVVAVTIGVVLLVIDILTNGK